MNKILLAFLCGIGFTTTLLAQKMPVELTQRIWQDEEFINRFLATYGVLSGAEPRIDENESELFEDLREIIDVNPDAAITRLQNTIGSESSAALDFVAANLFFQEGRLEEARQYYSSSLDKFPDYRRAHKNLALVHLQLGDIDEALPHLSKAIGLGEVDARSYGLLGYIYLNLDPVRPVSAEAAYRQAVLLDPETKDWKLGLASALFEQDNFDGARALFEQMATVDPNDQETWLFLTNASLGQEDYFAAARFIEVAKRIGELDSSNVSLQGDIYMQLGMYEMALESYQQVIAADGEFKELEAMLQAATLLSQYGSYQESLALAENLRSKYGDVIEPAQRTKLLNLEARNARSLGDAEKAASILQTVIENDPQNGEALLELAKYFEQVGEVEKAVSRLEQAQTVPDYAVPALNQLAQLWVRQRQFDKAVPILQRSLKIDSTQQQITEYLEKVERVARITRASS